MKLAEAKTGYHGTVQSVCGNHHLIAILVDSSQLERSLYMYADYIGTNTLAILILNLMDVAEKKKIHVDTTKLSKILSIPVIGFVASETKRYGELKEMLANAVKTGQIPDSSQFMEYYRTDTNIASTDYQQSTGIWIYYGDCI